MPRPERALPVLLFGLLGVGLLLTCCCGVAGFVGLGGLSQVRDIRQPERNAVLKYLKETEPDPDSIEILVWYNPRQKFINGTPVTVVRVGYSANDGAGINQFYERNFIVQDGKVLDFPPPFDP